MCGGVEGRGEWVNGLTISSRGAPDLRSRECLLIGQFPPHDNTPVYKTQAERIIGSYQAAHNNYHEDASPYDAAPVSSRYQLTWFQAPGNARTRIQPQG